MKGLKLGFYLNPTNIPPEEKVFNTVFIGRGGGGGVILTEGFTANINPDDQHPMNEFFLISETLLSDNQLPIQVKLLALTPTNWKELCAPMIMNLPSNEAAETLVFPVLSNTGEMIGQLYVSYHLTEGRNLVALSSPYGDSYGVPPGPYVADPGECSGHGGSGPAYPLPRTTQHLPMAYPGHHHGPVTNSVQESESQPLIDRYPVQGYPVQGYRPGFNPGYVGPPQPPGPGPQPGYPPLQQQASKWKKFKAAVGSVAKRIGVLACVNVITEAAVAAVAGDDGGGLI